MTDLAEIVALEERLREAHRNSQQRVFGSNIFLEAAEALASLRRELEIECKASDALAEEITELRGENDTLRKRIAEMEAERTIANAVIAERDKTVAELRAENERLVHRDRLQKEDIMQLGKEAGGQWWNAEQAKRDAYCDCVRVCQEEFADLGLRDPLRVAGRAIARAIEARRDEVCR